MSLGGILFSEVFGVGFFSSGDSGQAAIARRIMTYKVFPGSFR